MKAKEKLEAERASGPSATKRMRASSSALEPLDRSLTMSPLPDLPEDFKQRQVRKCYLTLSHWEHTIA